jgi:pyruvate/2-oxoglutarate dehydrogenase complex dihydrolipoamide dehydrogenase (E3) component
VTILGKRPTVLANEDPEIRKIVNEVLSRDLNLFTNNEVVKVKVEGGKKVVSAKNRLDNKVLPVRSRRDRYCLQQEVQFRSLEARRNGAKTNQHGWIKVNKRDHVAV